VSRRAVVHGERLAVVHDDRWMPILHALGRVEIERASDVEYDALAQEWVARYRATGEVIARGERRADVIQAEIAWIERRLAAAAANESEVMP
jgi:hypothetical protein